MQYLAHFKPIRAIYPGTVSLFVFLWSVADALQANLSVAQLAHISSVTFALLFNHNQPIMRSQMSHIPTLMIDVHVFTVGVVTNETVFGKRYITRGCSVTVNKQIPSASIHSQTGKSDQNGPCVCHCTDASSSWSNEL